MKAFTAALYGSSMLYYDFKSEIKDKQKLLPRDLNLPHDKQIISTSIYIYTHGVKKLK